MAQSPKKFPNRSGNKAPKSERKTAAANWSVEEAILAEIVHRYGDCHDQMNRLQFAILCELVDARLYREARGV